MATAVCAILSLLFLAAPAAAPVVAAQIKTISRADLSNLSSWGRETVDRIIPSRGEEPMRRQTVAASVAILSVPSYGLVPLALIVDRDLGKVFIVRGGQEFYLWNGTDLLACALDGGAFSWSKNHLAVPGERNDVEQVVRTFNGDFDDTRLLEIERGVTRVDLRPGVPFQFFTANSAGGSQSGKLLIDKIDLSGDVLRLDLASPGRRYTASFWVNLSSRRLMRSVVDGNEPKLP